MQKTVTILGATGSVGDATLDVIAQHPEKFDVVGMTAWHNADKAIALARRFTPKMIAVSEQSYETVRDSLADTDIDVTSGIEGMKQVATIPAQVIIAGIVGTAGLEPTLTAIKQGTTVGLANKESLVSAGTLVMDAVAKSGCTLLPVDSEHNAIFQVLEQDKKHLLDKIIITASGGAFRDASAEQLKNASVEDALQHPNWSMGAKLTIDSASLMNKGLELIEACHLFDVSERQIDIVVHPQSIVHSMVRYVDGSVLAQMGMPDMKVPVAYALCYPERMDVNTPSLDFATQGQLTFREPNHQLFPALNIARECQRLGQGATNIMNAANEVAVDGFIKGQISFAEMTNIVLFVLENMDSSVTPKNLGDVLEQDRQARVIAQNFIEAKQA